MKVVILAGGLGTRIAEESEMVPKPMVAIGGRPILWHIMKIYAHWGFSEFVVLTGYKSHMIKDYFINYYTRYSDITVNMATNSLEIHNTRNEPWKVTMLYTGPQTMTGGRLLLARDFLKSDTFMLTYGDGVSDINIQNLLACHKNSGKIATITAVKPSGRFGALEVDLHGAVRSFKEKGDVNNSRINGGFFVMEPEIFNYLTDGEATVLENAPMEQLVRDGQLNAYFHDGFWHAMDTLKDKNNLGALWTSKKAPWAVWGQ